MIADRKIRWGILGLGKIAHTFAEDLVKISNSELYAVASRTQEKATKFVNKYKAKKAFSSYEELANDPKVDVVYIATPHSLHKENSILCMQNKKAVLCEKAFAMNLQEVEEMIAVAKANNVLLMEALWTAFLPHFKYVVDIVNTKKFGELKELKADFGFYTPYDLENRLINKEVGGGSLLDIGIYPIFAALSTLGIPDTIEAKATFFENGADSSCDLVFNYTHSKAFLNCSLLKKLPTEAILTFEKAVIKIYTQFHSPSSLAIFKYGKEELVEFNYQTNGYNYEIDHFNTLLKEGKTESDVMTYAFSRNLIKLLDAVRSKIGLSY